MSRNFLQRVPLTRSLFGSSKRVQNNTLPSTLAASRPNGTAIKPTAAFTPATTERPYSMVINTAAWLNEAKAKPLDVKTAPSWTPAENEVLVKNHAVAINPLDMALQSFAVFPLNYPTILGQDVAGEVVAVGPNVTTLKPGSRVVGHAVGVSSKRDQDNGFQAYTILQTNMVSEIPDSISFESASVIPLGCSTAACGLFQDGFLKLQFPTEPAQKPTGKILLVWGGASSVGGSAIQLAVAAGYDVIATASAKNFDYVKKLGAKEVYDYSSETVVADLIKAFEGKTIAGAYDSIGSAAWAPVTEVVSKSVGDKSIATTKRGFPDPPEGVSMKNVFGTTLKDNAVGKAVYNDFLPKALKAGTFVPSPEPLIAGKGLESIQTALDLYQKGGLSAKKVAVSL